MNIAQAVPNIDCVMMAEKGHRDGHCKRNLISCAGEIGFLAALRYYFQRMWSRIFSCRTGETRMAANNPLVSHSLQTPMKGWYSPPIRELD